MKKPNKPSKKTVKFSKDIQWLMCPKCKEMVVGLGMVEVSFDVAKKRKK